MTDINTEMREKVARIIDPLKWRRFDRHYPYDAHVPRETGIEWTANLQDSLSKADAILALFSRQPADTGEECCRGRYVLWMVHVRGPDDIHPAPNYETAVEWADYANSLDGLLKAVPAIWTGSQESHVANLPKAIAEWTVPAKRAQALSELAEMDADLIGGPE